MKLHPLFVTTGICSAFIAGCNQPQKQESTNNDDVVWKANLSYCLSSEKLDWRSLKDGEEFETCEIFNFKIKEEKGNFRNLMKLFYDSAKSKTYPVYGGNPADGLSPAYPVTPKDKQMFFPDSIWNHEHTKLLSVGNYFDYIKAAQLNHEWLFDSKAGALKSRITDVNLETFESFTGNYFVSIAVLKFLNRTIDSLGTEQEALKPEITWGYNMLLPIADSGQGPTLMISDQDTKMDSLSPHVVNGISSVSAHIYPVCIKTTYNKKLVEWIVIAARNGQLPAYKYVDGDKIGEQLTSNELKNLNTVVDTFPDEHGIKKGYPHRLGAEDISGLELKEELSFHQSTFNFESEITYAGILIESINKNTGKTDKNISAVLYWVKLN